MAEKIYTLVHEDHGHFILVDEDIDNTGNGATSRFVPFNSSAYSAHEHSIENFEISYQRIGRILEHDHTGAPTPEQLRTDKQLINAGERFRSGEQEQDIFFAGAEQATTFEVQQRLIIGENVSITRRPANSIDTGIIAVDWASRTSNEPYFATNSSEYSTTVDACEGFVPGLETSEFSCEEAIQQAIAKGIMQLADFYNKDIPISEGEQLELLQSAAVEYHLSERPGERVKILVKIPARMFDKMIQAFSINTTVSEKDFSHSVIYNSSLIREQINTVSSGLDAFGNDADQQNIRISGINLKNESRRQIKFLSKLSRLLINNGFSLDENKEDSIEIGFNKGNKIAYVLFNSKSLDVGFSAFKNTDPVNNPTTVGCISKLFEMEVDLKSNNTPPLTEFILKYAHPRPEIFVSRGGSSLPSNEVKIRESQSMENAAASVVVDRANNIYVSAREKSLEDRLIRDPNFIKQQALRTETISNFAGDDMLFNLPELIDRVNSIEDIFSEVLNKINIDTITNFAVKTAVGKIPNKKDLVSGAIGTFLEKISDLNKKFINSVKSGTDHPRNEIIKTNNFLKQLIDFKALHSQFVDYDVLPDQPPGFDLSFVRSFSAYMADPNLHSHHKLDVMINDIQNQAAASSFILDTALSSIDDFTIKSDQFNFDIGMLLGEKRQILDGMVEELLDTDPTALISSLTEEFTSIADLYITKLESLTDNILPLVSGISDFVSGIVQNVTNFISDFDVNDIIGEVLGEIENRIAELSSMADELIVAVTSFPDEFMRMINSTIDMIKNRIDSTISEIINFKDSMIQQVTDSIEQIIDSVANIEEFLENFEIPSLDSLFDVPELSDILTIPKLPDNLPTFDMLGHIVTAAEEKLKNMVVEQIVDTVKETIRGAAEGITSGIAAATNPNVLNFGDVSINSTLMDGLGVDNIPGNVDALSGMTGQITELFGQMPPGTDVTAIGGRMGSFFNDVSMTLTPNETFTLLEGNPSSNTIESVKNTLNMPAYSDLRTVFANSPVNEAKIIDFFSHVGTFVGNKTIGAARQQMSTIADNYSAEDRQRGLLTAKYGDSLNPEQIEFELGKNLNTNAIRAFKLLQKSLNNDPGNSTTPTIIGGDDAIIPKNPPSVAYMTDRTLETIFEGIIMTFEQELHGPYGFIQLLCFRSGLRGIYEQMRSNDKSTRSSMLYTGMMVPTPVGPVPVPGPFSLEYVGVTGPGAGWIDKATEDDGSSQRLSEINTSPLGLFKAFLEGENFELGIFEDGLPSFKLKVLDRPGSFEWDFKRLGSKSFNHVLKIPAPGFFPYSDDSVLRIESELAIDMSKYGDDIADVLDYVSNRFERESKNPNEVFSSLATQDLRDKIPELDTEHIEDYLKNTAYHRIVLDIIMACRDEILKSILFSRRVEPYEMEDTDNELHFRLDPNAVANWRLEPKSDTKGQTQTTLLDLEDLKKVTKQNFENFEVGENEGISENLQKAIVGASVEAIVRLHVVEMFLKTLPVYDMFNKNDIISDEYIKYLMIKIQETCMKQDPYAPGYFESILKEVKKIYEENWNSNNKKLIDPQTGNVLPSPSEAEHLGPLNYFIKKTVLNASSTLRSLKIFPPGNPDSIYKIFLRNMMAIPNEDIFDVPTVDDREMPLEIEGLFSESIPIHSENYKFIYKDRFQKLLIEEVFSDVPVPVVTELTVTEELRDGLGTFSDGGLLLEKYIQYDVTEEILIVDEETLFETVEEETKTKIISLEEKSTILDIDLEEDTLTVSNIKIGMRLVYVHELVSAENEDLINHTEGFESEDITESVWEIADNSRSFRILERAVKNYDDDEQVATHHWTYPLPLVSVTVDATNLDDIVFPKEELIDKMVESDRFKLLFEHCFPLQKILSIMTIYTEVIFSSTGGDRMANLFSQTKDTLKTIFESAKNMNNFSYRDKNTESVGGNSGLYRGIRDGHFQGIRKMFPEGRSRVSYDNESASFVYNNETKRRP